MLIWESKDFFIGKDIEWIGDAIERLGRGMIEYAPTVTKSVIPIQRNGRFWFKYHKPWEYTICYEYLERLKQQIGRNRLKVMDFGFGLTPFPQFLAEQGHEVWGVDNGSWHGIGERKLKEFYPDVEFRLIDIMTLKEEGFDAIISASVLEHIPEAPLLKILHKLRQLLGNGGKMLHVVDFYFPERRGKSNHNFSNLCTAAGFSFDAAKCPGADQFDLEKFKAQNESNFMWHDWEGGGRPEHVSRIAIGDDL